MLTDEVCKRSVGEVGFRCGDLAGAVVGFKGDYTALFAVVNALEVLAGTDRPVDRVSFDTELVFYFVEQVERVACLAVHLVDEREYRNIAHYADLEQLAGLVLNALCRVDDHYCAVRGHERTVGVLGEVLVTGGVEDIYAVSLIVELHY